MKSILVLLSLIYFISCSTETCNSVQDAQSANDCFSTPVADTNNYCCYIQVKTNVPTGAVTSRVCFEYNKSLSIDEIKTALINQYKQTNQELEDFRCKGSYLKAGLLLLTAFLL